ncbi:MAG: hypothetical protein LUI10_01115 [Lachnospiraceae bacterium]|nr:hypothetical protein [Lachnospiraceae bacterium]
MRDGQENPYFSGKEICPGMSIVMSKWIGLAGTARLVREHEREVSGRLPLRMIRSMAAYDEALSVDAEMKIAARFDVCDLREVREGGIWRALWELGEDHDIGLTVDLHKIPVKQETIEVCEICGKNPYELLSGGAMLMVTWQGEAFVSALTQAGVHAAVIGWITDSHDRIVIRHTTDGVKVRYLNRPGADEIEKI